MTQEGQAIAALVDRFPVRVRAWMLRQIQDMAAFFFRRGIGVEKVKDNVLHIYPRGR